VSYEFLYAAQFAISALGAVKDYNDANAKAVQDQWQANKQAAINNQLNINAHLGLNEEQTLTLKKHGLDKWELWKQKRREEAKFAVLATERGMRGGTPRDVGGSYAAALNNITRHAYGALARKDLNFEASLNDFSRRHMNVDLQTINQNNAAFSGLSAGGSLLGSVLNVAGSGLQIANAARKGTTAPNRNRTSSVSNFGPSYKPGSYSASSTTMGAGRGWTS